MTLDPLPIPATLSDDPALAEALLALNNAHAEALSRLDRPRLAALVGMAFARLMAGRGQALLLAFDQDATYGSPNFLWFRARFPRFVYVDRIVVADGARGGGVARRLYEALFAAARGAGHALVVCEVNRVPPNPDSEALHAALGFGEVGQGSPEPGKLVRYLARPLADAARAGGDG